MRYMTVAMMVLLVGASFAVAAPGDVPSVAINFGADEPPNVGSPVTGAAGVLNTVNWNNLNGASGSAAGLIADIGGAPNPSPVSVEWSSPNTWSSTGRGEENNTAPAGNNRNLMTGYIDTGDVNGASAIVKISGIPAEITPLGYDVYVYMQGGVIGRGGDYTIGGVTKPNIVVAAFDGTFVEGPEGNYLMFNDVNLPDGFTLTSKASPNGFRAPINGVEVVANIPEPNSLVLVGVGAIGLLSLGRRNRSR